MPEDTPRPAQAAIRTALGAIFVGLAFETRDLTGENQALSGFSGSRRQWSCSRHDRAGILHYRRRTSSLCPGLLLLEVPFDAADRILGLWR
jgi:hypothetical protein